LLNLTGPPAQSVREIALMFGRRFGRDPVLFDVERGTALLSNAERCEQLFGVAPVSLGEMVDRVAAWVAGGGRSLNRPTHFDRRDGAF